ncbi:uncharacterized protein LOC105204736 [Solenopsis invicta]|uniref:uncharacterized protein LOC105204736 n=1 Tax=Solenopsis invicta TaxID=13686 RepID=UPI0005963AEE|nr:uncharacterized protein LOC105204736 [Solenopsis invicta]
MTKRGTLSEVAKLFDPLGWAAPVLEFAKIILQDLWLTGRGWDDPLPTELTQSWHTFRASLQQLEDVRLPCWVKRGSDTVTLELHGFSDASERAYAAAVYLRAVQKSGKVATHLLVARTKVAPIKTQSIPRLELCGAFLLARLLARTAGDLSLPVTVIYAWTDAQVVLSWLKSHASRWKPFVANRVAEVQSLLPIDQWNYIPTSLNPADAATRGVCPVELLTMNLWWHGPPWLSQPRNSWPVQGEPVGAAFRDEERRVAVHEAHTLPEETFVERFSSLTKLLRVTAYGFRFYHHASGREPSRNGYLTADELHLSRCALVRMV